jgi:hypothetical protein
MEIEWNRFSLKKIRNYLLKYGISSAKDFSRLKPVCFNESFAHTYRTHTQKFLIKKDIRSVWNIYASIHPKDAWSGSMISFGLQFSRSTQSISYLDDPYNGMEKGQILFLNLKLLWGLLNIAVAHEVAEIDAENRVIKLCYLTGGGSEGSQWISLKETAEGFTEVLHFTRYKSKSRFRDSVLYPPMHTKAIMEFHGNIAKRATSDAG